MKIIYPPTTPQTLFREVPIGVLYSPNNEAGVFLKTAPTFGRQLGTDSQHPRSVDPDKPVRIVTEIQITYQA